MPKPLQIELTEAERSQLEDVRGRGRKAYLRERAAAILKIADGMSALHVARHGLLKSRQCDTVCEWVHRYQQTGVHGLYIRSGRGRKAAFSPPRYPTEQQAQQALLMVVRREPGLFGHRRRRWRLQSILESCDWLGLHPLGGLSQLLKRLGIRFKRPAPTSTVLIETTRPKSAI